jgi:hypothetical protein
MWARIVQKLKVWMGFLTRDRRAAFRGRLRKLFRRQEAAKGRSRQTEAGSGRRRRVVNLCSEH